MEQRWLRFSIFCRNRTSSSLPHLPDQFLHSARINASLRLKGDAVLPLRMEMSISSVSVRTRQVTANPGTCSKSLLHSSSRLLPFSSLDVEVVTRSTSVSRVSEPHPERRAAISAMRSPTSSAACWAASSTSAAILRTVSKARPRL